MLMVHLNEILRDAFLKNVFMDAGKEYLVSLKTHPPESQQNTWAQFAYGGYVYIYTIEEKRTV